MGSIRPINMGGNTQRFSYYKFVYANNSSIIKGGAECIHLKSSDELNLKTHMTSRDVIQTSNNRIFTYKYNTENDYTYAFTPLDISNADFHDIKK